MADVEYRCFVGGLAWATDDRSLQDAFSQFGEITDSKVWPRPSSISSGRSVYVSLWTRVFVHWIEVRLVDLLLLCLFSSMILRSEFGI